MDEKPFFSFLLTEIKDQQIEELKKFHKTYYDTETIVNTASELKYSGEIRSIFNSEINNPSPDFVKHFAKHVYPSVITQKILDQFTILTKSSISQYLNDLITDRLKTALQKEQKAIEIQQAEAAAENQEPKIIITEEDIECFMIIKAILCQNIDTKRIVYRKNQSYLAILLDDNNRKTICRLYLDGKKKHIGIFDEQKKENRFDMDQPDDIFKHAKTLIKVIDYLEKNKIS
jgi:hypothetical protein